MKNYEQVDLFQISKKLTTQLTGCTKQMCFFLHNELDLRLQEISRKNNTFICTVQSNWLTTFS